MTSLRIFLLTALTSFLGCTHPVPKVTVDLLDTSLSITPRAERAAQTAILDQISRLGRGDRLIIIPITGDAQNDTGGKVLRLASPAKRQAYDNDLRKFQADAKKQYIAWLALLDQHQARTDILGTLDIARQEFAAVVPGSDRHLIILSDFLEDESSYNFAHAPQLATVGHARALGLELHAERVFTLPGVPVCLGRLESSDFAPLSPQRKDALQAFWTEYLSDRGQVPAISFDGTRMLAGSVDCYGNPNEGVLRGPARGERQP